MIDGKRWQLEKPQSVISNLRIGAPIPLRCIPCSSPDAAPIDGFWIDAGEAKTLRGEKSAPLVRSWVVCGDLDRSIEMHCCLASAVKNSGQELLLMPFHAIVQAHNVLHISWI